LVKPILSVDLTSGRVTLIQLPADWIENYLGGASLAARMLYDRITPELDPLSADAPLLFLTGPLTGTAGPAVGRYVVAGRSPATGLWGESNCGGYWGPELRKAGYDGLLITGAASEPVYILIDNTSAEIRTAGHLWGFETVETQTRLQTELNRSGVRIASIGPAGENLVKFALIHCDHGRVAGRTGLGAVMGAKRLKAIAVRGTGKIEVHNTEYFSSTRRGANQALRVDLVSELLRELGSAGGADYFDYLGEMPKRYFQRGFYDGAYKISGASISESMLVGISTCHACVIACGRVVQLEDGVERKGPEYETLVGFGPNLWIDDPVAITRLGELCDRLGLDTISMSNTIGLAFSLYEQGVISQADTDGLALEWGNSQVVAELIRQTARRQGFGALLADGSRDLARYFGRLEEAVQVNGLEVAYHDPRGASGMGLVYATSPRGACHNQSDYHMVDIGQVEEDLGLKYFAHQGGPEKAGNVARHQDWRTLCNSLVLCFFANVPPKTVLKLVDLACGMDLEMDDLLLIGERGWNLKRVINNRLGLSRGNDTLPKALLKPYSDGAADGFAPDLEGMLKSYYQVRGWDPVTGRPSTERLAALGLEWVNFLEV
jgi:aldehyde:ferredoxin oxidoreductase